MTDQGLLILSIGKSVNGRDGLAIARCIEATVRGGLKGKILGCGS